MARVLITGSADGLGLMAAAVLAGQGHAVTLHARNDRRAGDADRELPSAQAVITGDLSTIAGMRKVAEAANATGQPYCQTPSNQGGCPPGWADRVPPTTWRSPRSRRPGSRPATTPRLL